MANPQAGTLPRGTSPPGGVGSAAEFADLQLLERFRTDRDEAAFTALVQRHGRTVWGVCRRLLHQEQDAEDAFQAVFLLLARRAASIRKGEAVGSWLYGVAYRTALRARHRVVRRQARERQAAPPRPEPGPCRDAALRELQRLLDEEVQRLGARYRAPFVLCCLEGLSREQAARALGCKEGTLSARLARARQLLQQRLARRGITLAAALTVGALGRHAAAAPPVLLPATVAAMLAPVGGKAAAAGLSPSVLAFAGAPGRALGLAVLKAVGALALLATAAGVGAYVFGPPGDAAVAWQHRTWPADWPLPDPGPTAEGLGAVAAAQDGPAAPRPRTEYPARFDRPFKQNPEKGPELELFGLDADRCVQFEPAGLRITWPPGYPDDRPRTGIVTAFGVRGDFEITAGFEVLHEPDPADTARQTRLTVALPLNTSRPAMATLARTVMAGHGTRFLASVTRWDPASGKEQQQARFFPAAAKAGRLRLVRSGGTLFYYVADGPAAEFTLLHQLPFGKEDLKDVRVVGSTGDVRAGLDVRLTDLHVHAESLSDGLMPGVTPFGGKAWLVLALVSFLALLLVGLFWRRGRQGRPAPKSPGREAAAPAPTPAPVPAAAPSISFPCPRCGKQLAGKAELAGKNVKCPQCGGVVGVPAAGAGRVPSRRGWWLLVAGPALLVLAAAAAAALFLCLPGAPPSVSYLDRPLGAEVVPGVAEEGLWQTEFTKVSGEPFRWTNGHARLLVPLADPPPRAVRVRLGVPVPRRLRRLCVRVNGESRFDEPVDMPFEWSRTFDLSAPDLGKVLEIEVISDTFVPEQLDERTLGVCVRGITLFGKARAAP
jgi:RNA polymerase sigma factor (sigma-70 family)